LENDYRSAAALLVRGQPPGNTEVIREISVGLEPLIGFIRDQYYKSYIALGGSKIKFVTGKTGSGKTHFLQLLSAEAHDCGFITVQISARDVWLHDFKEIYAEVFKQSGLMRYLECCAAKVASELGYDYSMVPPGQTFVDYLSSADELNAITKKEIRNQLSEMFIRNPNIDNNFAVACSLLTGGILGHPLLESVNRELLLSWLSGSKDVKLPALRALGLSPAKITKFNARHMLRSLLEVLTTADVPGVIVMIDDMEVLNCGSSIDLIRYTKMRRDDVYESIRELIDEIDTLKNIMFFFSFGRILLDDEQTGLKSYQALWMRMQNEIVSSRFNKFSDFYDMDKYAESFYDNQLLVKMSERLADVINRYDGKALPIDERLAGELLANAKHMAVSLIRQVCNSTLDNSMYNEPPYSENRVPGVDLTAAGFNGGAI